MVNERVQVCYSFWVLSALSILRKVRWIDVDKLVAFILSAQVSLASLSARITVCSNPFLSGYRERGNSRPPWRYGGRLSYIVWCCRSVFLTPFTDDILLNHDVGLSILGYPGLEDLDPVYCMPAKLIEAKGLRKSWEALPRREV